MMRFRLEVQSIGDLDRVTGTQMLFAFQRFVAIVLDGEVQDEAPMPESHRQVGVDEAGLPVMGLSSQPFVPSSDGDVPLADGPSGGVDTDAQRPGESIEDYIARTAPAEHNPFPVSEGDAAPLPPAETAA